MRTLRFPAFVILAALLGVACTDHRASGSKSREGEGERESGLARQEQITQAVAEIEQLQEQRLFWVNFLDALYRAKPDRAWFTGVRCLTGSAGRPKVLLEGYVEYSSLSRWVPYERAFTQEEAVDEVLQRVEDCVQHLEITHSAHAYASGGRPRARARFWLLADLVMPAPPPTRLSGSSTEPEMSSEAVADRIRVLIDGIRRPDLPRGFIRNDVATKPHAVTPTRGEIQCPFCGFIRAKGVRWCPVCSFAPTDSDGDDLPDEWEDEHERVDRTRRDGDEDPDGDGFTNLKEYLAGSDPDRRSSVPERLMITRIYTEDVDLLFSGVAVKPGGDPDVIDPAFWMVSLRHGSTSKTEIVPLRATWHEYAVGPLERTQSDRPGESDHLEWTYVLTIRRRGEDPIRLVRNRPTRVREATHADFIIREGPDAGTEKRGKTIGDSIRIQEAAYRILAIHENCVDILRAGDDVVRRLYWRR